MGFWSSVTSWVSSAVSSTVSAVKSAAKAAWETTKELAAKAVNWMADKAEHFVGQVKEVWKRVKPYVQAVKDKMDLAIAAAPWPWLKGALVLADKALGALLAFENSALAKRLEKAIQWAIQAARHFTDKVFNEQEKAQAEEAKATFEEAADKVSDEQRRAIELAALVNNHLLVRTEVARVIDSGAIRDFEHYLRLRATQKLLAAAERKLRRAESVEDISDDDVFCIKVGSDLVSETPRLSDADAQRLDRIALERFGQKLVPFVFEEMIIAWTRNLELDEQRWNDLNVEVAEMTVRHRRFKNAEKIGTLTPEKAALLAELEASLPAAKAKLDEMGGKNLAMRNYVYAAEGFLQTLEKPYEQWEAEGLELVAEEGGRVGMIIIDCAQNGRAWESLTQEEQQLIVNYANIFEKHSHARAEAKQDVEVEVGA